MGSWGVCSYESDSCHDILDKLDHKNDPSAEMLERLLTNYCCSGKVNADWNDPRELYLGVVIWGLHHGVVVARKRLIYALKCVRHLSRDTEYLMIWKSPKARKQSLNDEYKQIFKWVNLTPKEFSVQKAVGSI